MGDQNFELHLQAMGQSLRSGSDRLSWTLLLPARQRSCWRPAAATSEPRRAPPRPMLPLCLSGVAVGAPGPSFDAELPHKQQGTQQLLRPAVSGAYLGLCMAPGVALSGADLARGQLGRCPYGGHQWQSGG